MPKVAKKRILSELITDLPTRNAFDTVEKRLRVFEDTVAKRNVAYGPDVKLTASGGSFMISSSSTNKFLPSLEVTLKTTGNPVFVSLQPIVQQVAAGPLSGFNSGTFTFTSVLADSATMSFGFLRNDNIAIEVSAGTSVATISAPKTVNHIGGVVNRLFLDQPPAGTHRYRFYYRGTVIGGYQNIRAVAYEL